MTAIGTDLRDLGVGIGSRVMAFLASVRRTTPAVLLLRLLVTGPLLAAGALALPEAVTFSRRFIAVAVLAVLAGAFPRTRIVGTALLAIGAAYFVTSFAGSGSLALWRVLALAATLYVAHCSAAMAAVLPHDCAVAPGTLARWASRTLLVLATSLAVGAVGMALVGQLQSVSSIIGPIVGSLLAAGIAGLMAWQLRRRSV
jgi:hypothetical protein